MRSPYRSLLLILLALLQLLAPLVHAHAGVGLERGLHVPGLEAYRDWPLHPAAIDSATVSVTEGFLFSVNQGIKEQRQVHPSALEAPPAMLWPEWPEMFAEPRTPVIIDRSRSISPPVDSRPPLANLSPRAPPRSLAAGLTRV